MQRVVTTGIVLRRTDYGEADRIVSVLTHNMGKVTCFAKAVRKPTSKLAGGIELFSVNDLTYIPGKGDMGTLVSSRVLDHFGDLLHDYDRMMYAYKALKAVDSLTEPTAGEQFFIVLREVLTGLNDAALPLEHVQLWFCVRLMTLLGSSPNLLTDPHGDSLAGGSMYRFDSEHMCFVPDDETGSFPPDSIKLLRVCAGAESPLLLARLQADAALFQPARACMQQTAGELLGVDV